MFMEVKERFDKRSNCKSYGHHSTNPNHQQQRMARLAFDYTTDSIMYNSFPNYTPIVLLFNHPLSSQLAAITSSDSHSVPIGVLLSCSCHTTLGICKQARCSCAPNFDLLFSLIAKPPFKFSTFPFKKI